MFPARIDSEIRAAALRVLTADQLEAFRQLPRFDQHHLICAFQWLYVAGHRDPNLLTAALLHDIGKHQNGHSVKFTDRVLKVVLSWMAPQLLQSLARPSSTSISHGLMLAVHHPEIGTGLARDLGCSELTCWLIRHHEDRDSFDSDLLAALQEADSAC